MIHVRDLSKHYADLRRGEIVALDGVSFNAGPGQIYGLLGPNGAGKTTVLRILSTVLQPTGGSASINACDVVRDASQVRRQIGFVSTNTAVYDRMTAWEMVEYFGRLYGLESEPLRRRMEEIFERLQMNEIRDLLGAKMSTGMKQKVSIARAIVHDPPVLIFDEATSGLDVLVARALLKTVADLRDHGKCVLFSTHIMREAEKLCDRIAIMHRGRILAEGTLAELRERHGEDDLEELFFRLISEHDLARARRRGEWRDMNWTQVKLIFLREVRDQLRDRRTLFMIAVLPLLLYPLLGMSFLRMSQFLRDHSVKVLVVGVEQLTDLPPLVVDKRFAEELFSERKQARLLDVETAPQDSFDAQTARADAESGRHDVVLYFRPDFADSLRGQALVGQAATGNSRQAATETLPEAQVFWNEAKDESRLGQRGVSDVLRRWREEVINQALIANNISATAAKPFDVESLDVAAVGQDKAALWSRILPFVLLLWALTGAFYPAVDLCAGEKERGTLETLLCSPAERREIVWGKLLTIMLFSMATAILNLLSLGITGSLLLSQMEALGPPPLMAVVWLLVALPPISALFSALCLSIAVFARSTKEGQYYLMPLVLITLPLTMLPMAPGVELNLGNSIIPISGFVLLLRTALEGNYAAAAPFVAPVALVTLACCQFAIRWATEQFNRESVLFRESERLDLGLWLKQLMRTRQDTPSTAEAIFCGTLILLLEFFMNFSLPKQIDNLARLTVVEQLAVIATPTLMMTIMLTRSPVKTLLLKLPGWREAIAAVLLALAIHPAYDALAALVTRAYPINDDLAAQLELLSKGIAPTWILLLWLVPPVCEELAFRGFILSGLRHTGHKWRAIVISSLFFGASHMLLQQSLLVTVMGAVLAFLAVQTGSLLPGILFHLTHNGLSLLMSNLDTSATNEHPVIEWLESFHSRWTEPLAFVLREMFGALNWLRTDDGSLQQHYHWPVVIAGGLVAAALLAWLRNRPYVRSSEEALEESLRDRARRVPIG